MASISKQTAIDHPEVTTAADAAEASGAGQGNSRALLNARGVSKAFSGVYALKDVDFDLRPGEVHALLGPNGAGKSTLIKILDGVQPQDEGIVEVDGRERIQSDIATVFQELSLVPSLSVAQNIFLGNELHNAFGMVQKKKMNAVAKELIDSLGLHLPPGELVENLSVASRQLVEIAKAVHRDARVLVLDEPTSTLTKADQLLLFNSIRDIQKSGVGIIYVTHRLTEVFELADRVTIIRDGRKVLTADVADLEMSSLVREITGAEPQEAGPPKEAFDRFARPELLANSSGGPKLQITDLAGDRFSDISFTAEAGRIVGIAGLIGTGRTELLETIGGMRRSTAGEIRLNGRTVRFKHPWEALSAGVALVPEDRHRSGLVMQHSIQRNLALAHHKSLRKGGLVDNRAARTLIKGLVETLQVKTNSIDSPVQTLSGGNQQKVVFAKWLQPGMHLLLLDEPTQGVDVRARQEIYRVIHRFAEEGAAIIVASSDFVELQELCDEIYFMTSTSMSGPETVTPDMTDQYIYSRLNERVRESHERDHQQH
ncbi:sugar ABC transporter ATP-binding protein [Pseudarthrobacter phenanthrenivorans]|uniref:sugar ABC transporter ATP-binding protein n=1 Tax=Pseudarthrobacter phenanthrenivorans TaxID=361575 RepID=UPI0002EF841C|nr:sugar ABC transporter ATP-binding protein [Pseudarthrobacter phenanthrenivorans]